MAYYLNYLMQLASTVRLVTRFSFVYMAIFFHRKEKINQYQQILKMIRVAQQSSRGRSFQTMRKRNKGKCLNRWRIPSWIKFDYKFTSVVLHSYS